MTNPRKSIVCIAIAMSFFWYWEHAIAQQFNVSISPSHLSKINSAKSGKEKLQRYRKYTTKDSVKQLRKLEKMHESRWDSLTRAERKQDKIMRLAKSKGLSIPIDTAGFLKQYQSLLPDSLSVDTTATREARIKALQQPREQSISRLPPGQRKQLEVFQNQHGQYSTEVKQYLIFLKDSVDHLDTVKMMALYNAEAMGSGFIGRETSGMTGSRELSEYKERLNEMKVGQSRYTETVESANDINSLKGKGKEAALEKFASQSEKIKTLDNSMTKLKGVYSTLLNSNDLSTGIKAKSLSGRPFMERLVIGTNFNIVSTAPFMMDLAAQLGYRIDKKFQVGLGGIYRATFVDSVNISNAISPTRYGYTMFSSYGLMANFFGYTEWERTASVAKGSGDKTSMKWTSVLLVGIGRTFRVHPKVSGSILILWNPLHENGKTPYHDALVIKTGFQLTPLALMKK